MKNLHHIVLTILCGAALFAPSSPYAQDSGPSGVDAPTSNWRELVAPRASDLQMPAPSPQPSSVTRRGANVNSESDAAQTNDETGSFSIPSRSAPSRQQLEDSIRQEAYDAALSGLFPLQPDQIRDLLEYYDQTIEATETPHYSLPKPEVGVKTVSLDPGVLPPVINVAVGHVTTLNILDRTGAPWPVQDVSWAGDFEVVEPQEGGHMIRITPMAQFAYGNLSIRLLTLKTPITFSLRTARDKVHYRLDARIPEFGPLAKAGLIEGNNQLVAGSPLLTSVLDGVPPGDLTRLRVSGVDGRTTAYRNNGILYVRTPLTLLSPGWQSYVSSADGTNVYALNDTPVVLLSDRGRFMRATITEKEDLFDE